MAGLLERVANFIERIVDELIAIIMVCSFVGGALYLTVTNPQHLKEYASTIAPFVSAIIGAYFGAKHVRKLVQKPSS